MKRWVAYWMCLLLVLMAALGHFVSSAVVRASQADANYPQACWQAWYPSIQTDACPEGRHLERGSTVLERGSGGRWSTYSFALVCPGCSFTHELLTASEQRLRQQCVGQQPPLQVLQCSWLI